jgi:hypothetical protein
MVGLKPRDAKHGRTEAPVLIVKLKYVYDRVIKVSNKTKSTMELQPGLFVHNAAAMRVALEHMRTTLSQEDWLLLRQELKRIGVLIPKQIKKEKNNTKKKNVENIIIENIVVENIIKENIVIEEVEVEVDCPICCDHHPKNVCVTTSCGHCFGKECFHLWAQTQQDKQSEVTCPLCVAPVLSLL